MSVRYIAFDHFGTPYEVTNLLDRHSKPTDDPTLAVACVVRCGDHYHEVDPDEVPIYTVH